MSQSRHRQEVEALSNQTQLWRTALASSPIAMVVVDLNERVIMVNEQAYYVLGLASSDECSSLPDLKLDRVLGLRTAIKQVKCENLGSRLNDVQWLTHNGTIYLDIYIKPITCLISKLLAVSLTFIDVTQFHQVWEQLGQTKTKLFRASEELKYTKKKLAAKNNRLNYTQQPLDNISSSKL